jgi:vacuolar protein sorting-associated protein 1
VRELSCHVRHYNADIVCSLPRLKEEVDKLLASCIRDLDALPLPLATVPQIEVLERVNAFCDVFKGFVNGSHEDKRLAQRNRALYAIFKRDIRGTAPDFRPFDRPEEYVPLDDIEGKMTLTERDSRVKVMGIYDVSRVIAEYVLIFCCGNWTAAQPFIKGDWMGASEQRAIPG